MLLHGAVWDPGLPADCVPALTGVEGGAQLLFVTIAEFRPPEALTVCSRPFETSFRPLADLLALELGERREGGQEDVADELVLRRQMLFSE